MIRTDRRGVGRADRRTDRSGHGSVGSRAVTGQWAKPLAIRHAEGERREWEEMSPQPHGLRRRPPWDGIGRGEGLPAGGTARASMAFWRGAGEASVP